MWNLLSLVLDGTTLLSQLPAATLHVEPCRSLGDPHVRKCRSCLSFMRAVLGPCRAALTLPSPVLPAPSHTEEWEVLEQQEREAGLPLARAQVLRLGVQLCHATDCSPPGSSAWFSGKNTGGGCQFLLQWIFLTQRSDPRLLHLHWQVDSLLMCHLGSLPAIAVGF